jgi:hypothetical protein
VGRVLKFFYEGLPAPWGPFTQVPFNIDHETGEIKGKATGSMTGKYRVTLVVQAEDGTKVSRAFQLEILPSPKVCQVPRESKLYEACELVQRAYEEGRVSGLESAWNNKIYESFYTNNDNGHSLLSPDIFPQLQYSQNFFYGIRYSDQQKGMLGQILFQFENLTDFRESKTFEQVANSSMAQQIRGLLSTERLSIPRIFMEKPGGLRGLYENGYHDNLLVVFPAVDDFGSADPKNDLFMGNSLYVLSSQGASGSDMPFVQAAFLFSAALSPELKAKILEGGYFVPVFQRALRRTMQGLEGEEAYLTNAAHPSAFSAEKIDYKRLVEFAFQMNQLGNLPPMALVNLLGEDFVLDENLYTTPGAIGRVWRKWNPNPKSLNSRTLILDAHPSFDPEGEALTYGWIVLQGDLSKIQIIPMTQEGSIVRIQVPYEDRRVDIGLFVKTKDGQVSAPAMISISNEVRGGIRIMRGNRWYPR